VNPESYIETNKNLWDARVGPHLKSEFYDLDGFREGKNSLNEIDLELLGDVRGLDVLHLQCHFGQDSISLARMGARVTGLDFSEKAINAARELAAELNVPASFVCANVYDAPKHISDPVDLIFTSYGVLGWLRDIEKWADVVSACLKPGGMLVLLEFHPVVWMFDDQFEKLAYSYFQKDAIIEQELGTYADKGAPLQLQSISWNHSLSSVIQSLRKSGLEIDQFLEYDFSPYPVFSNNVQVAPGQWQIEKLNGILPMVFGLKARKAI
jgi:SAM-dependent methyltransferase